jgi:tetratricopeptide (TPR) repeat protein
VSTPERLWRSCRRNPRQALLSAAVVLLLVAVAATSSALAWQAETNAAAAPQEDTGDLGGEWHIWAACRILRCEAEALPGLSPRIDPSARPTDPPYGPANVFDRAPEQRPTNPRVWLTRGLLYIRQGQWDKGAADFKQAFALQPSSHLWEWYLHATLRLWAGDTDGYRAACKEMLERFDNAEHAQMWDHQVLALACFLAPDAVPDVQVPAKLAEIPVAAEPENPWFLLTLGAARYRTGQPREALQLFSRALRGRWSDEEDSQVCGTALIRLFQSLAYHRLGDVEEARQRLKDAGASIVNAAAQEEGKGNRGKEWHIWAACQVLRREAEAQLNAIPPPR